MAGLDAGGGAAGAVGVANGGTPSVNTPVGGAVVGVGVVAGKIVVGTDRDTSAEGVGGPVTTVSSLVRDSTIGAG